MNESFPPPPRPLPLSLHPAAVRAIAHVAALSTGPCLDRAYPLTLNFHPDRLHHGLPLLQSLLRDGVYRSQFETGTSNGGLSAFEGGARWTWQSRIFGGAYDGADPCQRPRYGALNYRGHAAGGSPRFGSAHLRLRPEVAVRSTFCYPDSVFEPAHFGCSITSTWWRAPWRMTRTCSTTIEAHVHGPVRLDRDVEALVLDPCYRGTGIDAIARGYPCAIEWHPGFRLAVDVLRRYPDYRGQRFVDLGTAIAHDGWLDPAILGRAAASGRYDPQDIKKVWHYLARFGAPRLMP